MIIARIRRYPASCLGSSSYMVSLITLTKVAFILSFVPNNGGNIPSVYDNHDLKYTSKQFSISNRRDTIMDIATYSLVAATMGLVTLSPSKVHASDDFDDLTTKMFNKDGSLKQEMQAEAKFRNVNLVWGVSDMPSEAVDGRNTDIDTETIGVASPSVSLQYKLPEKWGKGNDLYLDKSEGKDQKVCERIVVYQAPGKSSIDRLDKASRIGVYNSLQLTEDFTSISKADLIGGRIINKGGQKYYEFDMALAPSNCDSSAPENLGLGFCPYESIYLLSSTIVNDRLYVFVEECKKDQWKRSNAELKTVRSSFIVEQIA